MKKTINSIIRHLVLLLLSVIWLVPILWLFVTSFSGYKGINTSHFFPETWTLDNYKQLFFGSDSIVQYNRWFMNTLVIAIFTCIISTILVLMVAYTMSKLRFGGRKALMSFSIILNMFPGVLSMIAVYFVMKSFGLTNSHVGMIIVYSAGAGLGFLICKGFMDTISTSLSEAARLEGASEAKIFWKIIIPLSKPITVVMALYYGVGRWNSYFVEMIYLKDRDKYPLQLFLREILTKSTFAKTAMANGKSFSAEEMMALIKQADTANMLKYGVIVISALPMLLIYPFLQKYFEQGIMIGSVKG